MATGIRTNLDWLEGSGIRINRGIVVDDHLRSSVPNVYAAGDVAEGRDLVSGEPAVHAIEPTAQEHGRVAGANMAGRAVAYRGSLIANIVEVCHLDVASFGAWDDARAQAVSALKRDRSAYRKLLFSGFVPASPGTASLSFLGIVFEDARIARVRISSAYHLALSFGRRSKVS